jgi:hypothetical protein
MSWPLIFSFHLSDINEHDPHFFIFLEAKFDQRSADKHRDERLA